MATYRAITRIRTDGALFLPGDEVWGLSESDAAQLLVAGSIEVVQADAAPKKKGAAPKQYTATPLTPRTKSG